MSASTLSLRAPVLALLIVSLSPAALTSESMSTDGVATTDTRELRAGLERLMSAYSSSYPDIHFIHLGGSADIGQITAVMRSLGEEAVNVDYDHPPELRQTLVSAQTERMRLMLTHGLPSATLFRTGSGASIRSSHVCVITLDVEAFNAAPRAATSFLLGDLEISTNSYIDNEDFLYFALDHEIFHCLDAFLNGPTRPRTWSEVAACYYDYRAERRADLYAALTHRTRNAEAGGMLRTLAVARTLSLSDGDLPHYTAPTLEEALHLDRSLFGELLLRDRVQFAMRHSETTLVSLERYREFVAAAGEYSLTRGRGEAELSSMYLEVLSEGVQANDALVRQLASKMESAKRQLDSMLRR